MILYGELTKVETLDDGSIRVHGVASTGARDDAGETVLPEAMKAALPAYMAFGAIREMHQPRAAGAALHAEVGEDGVTRISAHIVDPTAIAKVKAGVYKGLSIGGKVLARDPADPTRIVRLRLDEISLVDRPCNPEAVIDLWKAAALDAPAAAPSNETVRAEAEAMAKAAGRPGRRNDYVAAARARLMERVGASGLANVAPNPDRAPAKSPHLEPVEGRGATPGAADAASSFDRLRMRPGEDGGESVAKLQGDLAKLAAERDDLARRLALRDVEIARLRAEPQPPRTAASTLFKAVAKTEDGGQGSGPLSPDAFAEALAALPPAERAHLLMKAALAQPMTL